VDDSIVRGTTSKKIIELIREAGAREVHLRIAAPPTISPCFYGIDTPRKEDLIASRMSVTEIEKFLQVQSLRYLSMEEINRGLGIQKRMCDACFTGDYPVIPKDPAPQKSTSLQ
jgi:amidophosphoribosyltransferase